jgi:large subunit ribosomal protein L4
MSSVTMEASAAGRRGRERPEPERRTVQRRRTDGTVVDEVVLDPQIFGIEPNEAVLHQVVTAQLAAARSGTQSTKTRSEVAGGGAKPYRQKGTGRSRQGSIRSPQWVGGGIALGPKPRKYRQRTPKKMVRLALLSALSDRASEDRVALVDEWSFEVPKTKDAVAALEALGIEGRVLVVLGPYDGVADRSFANLSRVQTVQSAELNAYDVVRSDWVVFSSETLIGEVEVTETSVSTPADLDAEAPEDEDETADAETSADVEADAEDELEDSEEAEDEEDSK